MVDQTNGESHWNQLVAFIKQKWNELSDSDLQQLQGDLQGVVALVQERTGLKRELIEAELDAVLKKGKLLVDQASQAASDMAGNASDVVQQQREQAEELIKSRPVQSVAAAFGVGLVAGVVVGLVLRSR